MRVAREVEVAVIGAGLVGLAAARALAGPGTVWIGAEPPPAPDALDARIYALGPGNRAFLEALGAWRAVRAGRVAPVHAMQVHGDDGRSRIVFDAWQAGVEALAWIVEEAELAAALRQGLEAPLGTECSGAEFAAGRATLVLADGGTLAARLVIGADGARSRVRAAAGIGVRESSYRQQAVVAHFACERPHRNAARQWFQADGAVLALLPLPGERVSMVWSLAEAEAQRLMGLEPAALGRELSRASQGVLGELVPLAPAKAYALRRARAERAVAPRLALVGDAAHVVHPLAGQGANLGLQDVRVLARVLGAREPGRDPGELGLLRRYERARAEAVLATDAMVHGLARLFAAESEVAARLRNAGLGLVDRLVPLKNLLARYAMA